MYLARILYPVRVLGPGNRIGLWLSGCGRRCPGCSNPELWAQKPEQRITVDELSALMHRLAADHPVDGLTITGGEPFDQCGELSRLLSAAADITGDVLIYTGYTLEALTARRDPDTDAVLARAAVLIDGDYRQEQNTLSPLAGSANQRIHHLKPAFRTAYEQFIRTADHTIQNFSIGSSVVSVGIHHAAYAAELPEYTARKGLMTND